MSEVNLSETKSTVVGGNTWIGEWSHSNDYGSRIILTDDGAVRAFPSIISCAQFSRDQINKSRESLHYSEITQGDLVFYLINPKAFTLSLNSYVYTFTCLESSLSVHLQ